MKKGKDLTVGSVPKSILSMAFPMMIGMFSIVAFNITDTYFIGRLGTTALAAISFTLPVVMLQGAISMGLGIGVSSLIAQAIGKKNHNLVKRLTTDALILSVMIVIITIIVGLLTITPLFTALGATGIHLKLIWNYMFIWYLGVPFVVIPMVGNNAIRATGNTKIPSLIMIISVVINIILDPLLIFGIGPFPELGLQGAAIATVIARASTFCVSLYFLHFKFNMLTKHIESISNIITSWKKILYIAVPAALTQVLMPISMGYLTRLISTFGESAVAAIGISTKIEMFAFFPLMALGSVLVPFVGQNLGAKKIDRIQDGISFSNKFVMLLGLFIFIIFRIFNRELAMMFDDSTKVISIVSSYLIIVSVGYGFLGISAIGGSIFNALNKPLNAALLNFIRMILIFVPLTYIGSVSGGLNGIFIGIVTTFILSGTIAFFWIRKTIGNDILRLQLSSKK